MPDISLGNGPSFAGMFIEWEDLGEQRPQPEAVKRYIDTKIKATIERKFKQVAIEDMRKLKALAVQIVSLENLVNQIGAMLRSSGSTIYYNASGNNMDIGSLSFHHTPTGTFYTTRHPASSGTRYATRNYAYPQLWQRYMDAVAKLMKLRDAFSLQRRKLYDGYVFDATVEGIDRKVDYKVRVWCGFRGNCREASIWGV